tara:strand:- start:39 stop:311 length:273 start_codon:yes stop_codon:yes gene_type:complete
MGYNMNGFSGFGNSPAKQVVKGKKQVPLSKHEKKKGTEITGGSDAEVINDLEDRIEFLQSDIADGDGAGVVGQKAQLAKLKIQLSKERKK